MDWIASLVQGVLLGGLYALFAAGLSLIFGVMRLVNIAHGDLIILAAYLGQRLDGICHFHRRHWRYWHSGRADHWHVIVLPFAGVAGRFRHDLPDGSGAGGDCGHAARAQRGLGPDPRSL